MTVNLTVSRKELRSISWLIDRPKTYTFTERKEHEVVVEKLLVRLLMAANRKGSTGN